MAIFTSRIVPLSLGWMLAASTSWASPDRGDVRGRVVDQTGAALPGVAVTLSAPPASQSTVTDGAGVYRFVSVVPGRYRISFALLGFAEHTREIAVASPRATQVDASLHVALLADVTVTGRRPFRSLSDVEHHEANLIGLATAATEGAITARQIAHRPLQRAGDLVETVPGLSVTQHSGEGKANQYYLRGFNLDHGTDFSTTVAGVPVNLASHAHGHGYTDTNFLIPELVTGIQYFKGPYTAEAGDFSSAGGINVNYARVLDAPMVRISTGGQGWSRLFAAAAPRLGSGHLLAAAETAANDGPWERPDDYRRYNTVLRYSRGTMLNHVTLTALAHGARWNGSDQAPRRAIEAGTISRFGTIDTTTGGETSRYAASAELQHGSAASLSRMTGYAVAYDLNLFSNFTYFLDDPVNGDQFHQADRRLVWGLRGSHARLTRIAERPVEYRVGVEFRLDDIGLIGLYRTRGRQRLSSVREDEVTQASGAIWSDVDIRWTTWLRSVIGLRADGYRFRVAEKDAQQSNTASDGVVSPKGSFILGPWSGTELYLNGGYGFHSNDARAATLAFDLADRFTPADGIAGRPATPLARTRGAEIGVRTVAIPGVHSTLAVWRLALDSELVFVGDAGTTVPNRPSLRSGIEWSTVVRLRPWLRLDADLAWSRARFADGDPAGPYVPGSVERVASVILSADGPSRISASVRWRLLGSRPLVEDNSVRSRATSLASAQLGYQLSDRLTVTVDAFNILDARHSDVDYFYRSRVPGEPDEGVDDVHSHPALPRSARVTLHIGF